MLAAHGPSVERLCEVCVAEVDNISGAGLAVMTALPARGTRYVSDKTSARVEELQFSLGEGPCFDAYSQGRPMLVPDLAAKEHALVWPAFAGSAVASGARALFAFPLRVGAIRIGVLNLYRDRPGELDDEEVIDAQVFADSAAMLLLAEDHSDPAVWQAQVDYDERAVVHQATGMVMVQLGGTIADAFVRLQAHAYALERPLGDIAEDVVSRRVRFDDFKD
jgi:hypothetical protein